MRILKFGVCFVLALSVASLGRTTPAIYQQDSGPSLADTMKFIQDKLNAQASWLYSITTPGLEMKGLWKGKFEDVTADPTACTFSATSVAAQYRTTTSFSLKDITSVEYAQSTGEDPQTASVTFNSSGSLITQIIKVNPDDKEFYKFAMKHNDRMERESHVSHAGFSIATIEMATRLAKAMSHAANLCGAKPEPF
jgi:hypothetical protein